MQRSRLAVVCGVLGALGVLAAVLGPVLIHAGAVSPFFGFRFFFAPGLLLGLTALILSPFALLATRRRTARGLAWLGLVCGVLLVGVVAVGGRGAGGPFINDVTTDLADPPAFASDPAAEGRDMAYPTEFVPQAKRAYGDLMPIRLSSDPAQALVRSEQTARELGWEVVSVDAAAGTLLARETSKIFRFVDDIVVRARPGEDGGAIIDVRSKSRVGRGAMGANAARIRRFAEKLPR